MPNVWQATRWGYVPVDPDDAPTEAELFAEQLAEIWQDATPQERRAIARERGALGVRDKRPRDLTATEQDVIDNLRRMSELMRTDNPVDYNDPPF